MNIKLNNLKYSIKSGFSLSVNLEIPANSWIVITGETGSGKTTLLKLLAGIIAPDSGEIYFGIVNPEIGFIFQNPDDQLIQLSIEKELVFNLENQAMPINKIRKRLDMFLEKYGFNKIRKKSPNNLSDGEKQRLALAATLISEPDILIFDEPTSFLDYKQRELLYQQIDYLKQSGKTIIWTSHDIDEYLLADYILELKNGQVSYLGSKQEFIRSRLIY